MDSTNKFTMKVINSVPGLQSIYREHIADYDELLSHVFFGDLTRYVVELYSATRTDQSVTSARTDLIDILALLEEGMTSTEQPIQELIAVSFLENLGPTDSSNEGLITMLGASLRDEYTRIWQS